MTPRFQYLDSESFNGVLDYIAEVRLPGHDRLLQLYLTGSQGIC